MAGKPIYTHDCDECTYFKTELYRDVMVDFYIHDMTVIYRDGNEASQNGAVDFQGKEEVEGFISFYQDLYEILQEFLNSNKDHEK